jgi:hypothetical protein
MAGNGADDRWVEEATTTATTIQKEELLTAHACTIASKSSEGSKSNR